jgi:predicted Fe-Mo cluster-binding NifX family protein
MRVYQILSGNTKYQVSFKERRCVMKVAVSASGKDLDTDIDPRFGRCRYFLIIDTEDMDYESFENENAELGGGAGIQSAQFVASKGAKAVITGRCGPNAVQTLKAAGIEMYMGQNGSIKAAVDNYINGVLSPATDANAPAHAGMGGRDMGRGKGMGGGKGMGRGRGMGGQGGGRGRGNQR